jgi:hypothetical protein
MAKAAWQPADGDGGFGLVEVLLSITVLLIVLVASSYVITDTVKQASINRQKVAAAELAEQYIETTANSTLASLQSNISKDVLLTATPVSVGGTKYSVWSHLEWATTGSQPSLCSSGNPPEVIRATMTVKWGSGIQAESLGETAIVNPPYGTVLPGDGFLSVQINGASISGPSADKANLINVQVNVSQESKSGSTYTVLSTTTYNPDQNGCVYLQVPAGYWYGVSLASPTGGPTYIDWQDATTTPSQPPVQVPTAGLPSFVTFHYDEAGTVTLSPTAGPSMAANLPVSVSNGSNLTQAVIVPSSGSGANATSELLFPYANINSVPTNYSVWYGDCIAVAGVTQEQPAAPTTFSLAPKGSASAVITGLDVLPLAVTQTGAGARAPTAVAVVADPNYRTDGCSGSQGESYTLTGFSGSGTAYSDSTQIIPQTYAVTVTDPNNSRTTSVTMVVSASGVTVGATNYPTGTPVPVTVP